MFREQNSQVQTNRAEQTDKQEAEKQAHEQMLYDRFFDSIQKGGSKRKFQTARNNLRKGLIEVGAIEESSDLSVDNEIQEETRTMFVQLVAGGQNERAQAIQKYCETIFPLQDFYSDLLFDAFLDYLTELNQDPKENRDKINNVKKYLTTHFKHKVENRTAINNLLKRPPEKGQPALPEQEADEIKARLQYQLRMAINDRDWTTADEIKAQLLKIDPTMGGQEEEEADSEQKDKTSFLRRVAGVLSGRARNNNEEENREEWEMIEDDVIILVNSISRKRFTDDTSFSELQKMFNDKFLKSSKAKVIASLLSVSDPQECLKHKDFLELRDQLLEIRIEEEELRDAITQILEETLHNSDWDSQKTDDELRKQLDDAMLDSESIDEIADELLEPDDDQEDILQDLFYISIRDNFIKSQKKRLPKTRKVAKSPESQLKKNYNQLLEDAYKIALGSGDEKDRLQKIHGAVKEFYGDDYDEEKWKKFNQDMKNYVESKKKKS